MVRIRLTFEAGRYHATPWGRHVNEGVAEWPPSPYRLLRALYDVWQRKCFDLQESEVRAVLEKLAESPPCFHLPRAVAAHTRSYLSANSKDPTDKNLVFDPFLVFDRPHACFLSWPDLSMAVNEQETLRDLLRNLNYLGRSESWVQAEWWEGTPDAAVEAKAQVAGDAGEMVACVTPAGGYAGEWLEALTYSTWSMIKQRASSPPLLRQVAYSFSEPPVSLDPARRAERRRPATSAVMLSLHSRVLPLATTTLEVAEQVRIRLMGAHKKRSGDPSKVSAVFSGKAADGQKRLDHGHVYILPQANQDSRIDRVLIVNPKAAFLEDELDAIHGVRELWQSDGRPKVQCVITWQGEAGAGVPFAHFSVVESITPFVPPRNWRKGRDPKQFVEDEVRRECRNHGIKTEVVGIEATEIRGPFHVSEYRRNRKGDPVRPGYALRLTFAGAVPTPFAIGYGAHFGLGQFDGG